MKKNQLFRSAKLNNLNDEDLDGAIPLHLAVSSGRLDITQALIQRGADINKVTNTYHHIRFDSSNGKPRKLSCDAPGVTPLYIAARKEVNNIEKTGDWIDIVKLLIEEGADQTKALFLAIEGGSIDEVELLLNCGANPNKARDDGETPISFALFLLIISFTSGLFLE